MPLCRKRSPGFPRSPAERCQSDMLCTVTQTAQMFLFLCSLSSPFLLGAAIPSPRWVERQTRMNFSNVESPQRSLFRTDDTQTAQPEQCIGLRCGLAQTNAGRYASISSIFLVGKSPGMLSGNEKTTPACRPDESPAATIAESHCNFAASDVLLFALRIAANSEKCNSFDAKGRKITLNGEKAGSNWVEAKKRRFSCSSGLLKSRRARRGAHP